MSRFPHFRPLLLARDASETMNVTAELLRRGNTEDQIRKLWGGNLLRVWSENQRVAAELRRTRA